MAHLREQLKAELNEHARTIEGLVAELIERRTVYLTHRSITNSAGRPNRT